MNTGRFRFSLASLMIGVLFIALGCAALRYASDLWASVGFTLTVGVLLVAILGVLFRGGDVRAFCLGLSLFGWGYLFLVFGPWFRADSSPRPPALLTTKLLGYMHPMLSKTVTLPGSGSGTTPFLVTTVYGGSPPVTVIVPSWDQFQQVGHSLLALIIALVGGVLARYCYVIRSEIDQRTGSPPA